MNTQTTTEYRTNVQPYRVVEQVLTRFSPIHLYEMTGVSLLNRIDTKYLIPLDDLTPILERIRPYYRVLDIDQIRLNRYHTIYFDAPDFTFYNQHHNRHADRYKVRTRQYVDTDLTFFEVKHKTNKRRTIKSRFPLEADVEHQFDNVSDFVEDHAPVNAAHLEPKLWNDYLRLTLVGVSHPERVTIDLALSFGHNGSYVDLPGLAIAEVKQKHFSHNSYFIRQMRHLGIRRSSFSKYCAGVYLLYDGVKTNNFKLVMQRVQQLTQREIHHASIH